jgi:DNA-binding response OmpR family regulator
MNSVLRQETLKELQQKSSVKKVLVIDDERCHQVMVKAWLALLDIHAVDIVATGKEGLSAVTKNNYALILLDIGLPDVDGYEVCQKIRKRKNGRTVPIIINTIRPIARQVWRNVGASGILIKPLLFHHLEYLIDHWVQPVPSFRECA